MPVVTGPFTQSCFRLQSSICDLSLLRFLATCRQDRPEPSSKKARKPAEDRALSRGNRSHAFTVGPAVSAATSSVGGAEGAMDLSGSPAFWLGKRAGIW